MSIQLNHTIVACRDNDAAAAWFTELFGLPDPAPAGHFRIVELGNGVSLDYASTDTDFPPQHYAFLVSDDEFTSIYGKIVERGIEHWADPRAQRPGEINRNDGGRGVYFQDPDGHYLEIITVPYGGWPT